MFGASLSSLLGQAAPKDPNVELPDTSEVIYFAPQALLKMLKHGRAGIPMEVMGLMLGEFIDQYTIQVVDVFAMPQSGTGVAVEDIDPVFQSQMLDMLHQVGREEIVVGWYHSHPGLGCWLSSVDQNTHNSFQQLQKRTVAVVIDPVQSVKGKVVIDAFRLNDSKNHLFSTMNDSRQTTSNNGSLRKPTPQALIHGLNRMYYSINCDFKVGFYERQLLMPFKNKNWFDAFSTNQINEISQKNDEDLLQISKHVKSLTKQYKEDQNLSSKEITLKRIGQTNHQKHIANLTAKISDRTQLFDRSMIIELYSLLQLTSLNNLKFQSIESNC